MLQSQYGPHAHGTEPPTEIFVRYFGHLVAVSPSPWAGHQAGTHVTGEQPRSRRARRDSACVTCQPPTGPATSLQPTGTLASPAFRHPSTDEISVEARTKETNDEH